MATINKISAAATLISVLLLGATAHAATPAEKCQAAKMKAAGKKASCLARQGAVQMKGGTPDFGKCSARFSDKFAKAEAAAGPGICPTEGDAAAIESQIDTDAAAITAALSGMRFIDNGDGTVSDTQTGLMWEMKTDDIKDNTYMWSASGPFYPTAPDSTVFTVFLGGLNSCVWPGYGTAILGGFAGHCDWRLPTIVELQTIVDLTASGCGSGSPCIDPAFGPTVASVYWSSTAGPGIPTHAWGVDFFDGGVPVLVKTDSFYVRAVRGGL